MRLDSLDSNPHRPQHPVRTHSRPRLAAGLVLLAVAGLQPATAGAEEPVIMRVEEDWELAIADPDPAADAPQVVFVFGPDDPEQNIHAVLEMNHGTMPYFAAGGMQLQCWWQDHLLGYRNHTCFCEFEASIDTVTFTTVTEITGCQLHMEIINGNSITWGTFGGEGALKLSIDTWRDDLNTYDANQSIKHSRVSFGANRVNRLVRREVRYYSANGLEATDTEDRYVHQLVIDQPAN